MTRGLGRRQICIGIGRVVTLAMTGCATHRPLPRQDFWSGRLALQVLSVPVQNWNVSFELQGTAEEGDMRLFSPIGTTLARLSWSPQSALLEQGSNKTVSSDLQSLSQQLTGTALPIKPLFQWLAGQMAETPGWQVDLSGLARGRLEARRSSPTPEALLQILLDP